MIDRDLGAADGLLAKIVFLRLGDLAHPFGNLAVGRVDPRGSAGDRLDSLTERRLDRAHTVTGSTPPWLVSRMPKGAANFTSGGGSAIATSSGKRRALARIRPLSSLIPSGIISLAVIDAGSGGAKEIDDSVAL